jgi:hypothetical protein
LGLLDTAKAYPLLKSQHPEAVARVSCIRANTLRDYGDYTIKTEEVFRFDDSDTLVFRVVLSNKTARIIRYLPQSFMVQAGERVFYQSITDGTGEIPAQASVPVYFAITGAPEGGRSELSPRNDFMVLVQRLDSPPVPQSTSPPPPTNELTVVTNALPPASVASGQQRTQPTVVAPQRPSTAQLAVVPASQPLQFAPASPNPVVRPAVPPVAPSQPAGPLVVTPATAPAAQVQYPVTYYYTYTYAPPAYYQVPTIYYYAPQPPRTRPVARNLRVTTRYGR